jgi:hypothetical protein
MKIIKFLLQSLLDLLKGLGLKAVPALIALVRDLLKALKNCLARRKLPHPDRNATNEGCGTVHHPSFHRPDPLIYSQKYLLQLGLAVTWDNPDIVLRRGGIVVPEGELLPNTEYEIDATVWNNSFDAPAVGLRVDFSFLSFGAGAALHSIGSTAINLGVKGGANHPAHAKMLWTTPPAGHYCIQVDLKWADDANPDNNLGQNNVNVIAAQSPAIGKFTLKNDTGKPERYRFRVDTYELPQPKVCDPKIVKGGNTRARWEEIKSVHNPASFPVPPGWTVAITPPEVSLMPDQEIEVEASVTPPDSFTGRKSFNVNALYGNGRFAGGVTFFVTKS